MLNDDAWLSTDAGFGHRLPSIVTNQVVPLAYTHPAASVEPAHLLVLLVAVVPRGRREHGAAEGSAATEAQLPVLVLDVQVVT